VEIRFILEVMKLKLILKRRDQLLKEMFQAVYNAKESMKARLLLKQI